MYFLGNLADATTAVTNSTAIGYGALVGADNVMNLGNICNVGINNPTPNYTLHLSNVNNVCSIALDNTIGGPTPTSGVGILYASGNDIRHVSDNGIDTPLNLSNLTIQAQNVSFATLNSGPFTIPGLNTVNAVNVTKILLYQITPVTGGDLYLEFTTPSTTIMTFSAAQLAANTILTEKEGAPGPGYFLPIGGSLITLNVTGTLLTGEICIQVEYFNN